MIFFTVSFSRFTPSRVQFGNPETSRENQAIRANLRIDSREPGHLRSEPESKCRELRIAVVVLMLVSVFHPSRMTSIGNLECPQEHHGTQDQRGLREACT